MTEAATILFRRVHWFGQDHGRTAMTAAATDLQGLFLGTEWNLLVINNSATAVKDDSIAESYSYSFVKPQFGIWPETADPVLLDIQFEITDNSQSVSFQPSGSSPEGAADTLPASAPDTVQVLFQRAENQLSASTEIMAQYALNLLRRIKTLIVEIWPGNIQGRVLAVVDRDDGAATIEWIRNRSRLGFVLDRDNESSWFIVLPDGMSKSGYLYGDTGLKSLRGLLEEFIFAGE